MKENHKPYFRHVKKILTWGLLLIAAGSVCQLLAFLLSLSVSDLYFSEVLGGLAPNFTFFSSVFTGLWDKDVWFILLSCLVIVLIIAGALSIKRSRLWLPMLSFILFLADLVQAVYRFMWALQDDFINTYVIFPGIVDSIGIVLFCLYFAGRRQVKPGGKPGENHSPAV